MITGRVNAQREARIPFSMQDTNGHEQALDAVIDTGYTGGLTLPPALIVALGLTWRRYASAVLSDGSLQQFEVYAATVLRDGQARVAVSGHFGLPLLRKKAYSAPISAEIFHKVRAQNIYSTEEVLSVLTIHWSGRAPADTCGPAGNSPVWPAVHWSVGQHYS